LYFKGFQISVTAVPQILPTSLSLESTFDSKDKYRTVMELWEKTYINVTFLTKNRQWTGQVLNLGRKGNSKGKN
jgi:hypothetical protein